MVEAVAALQLPGVECLTDFQLQVEHALDLQGRSRVLFVDASYDAEPPFQVTTVQAQRDGSYTTHEMSPEAVLHVFTEVLGSEPPPVQLLAIRGQVWDLGAAQSEAALRHLDEALSWVKDWAAT